MSLRLIVGLSLLAEQPQAKARNTEAARPGTVAPERPGVYLLADGRYARFLNGHWRRPAQSIDIARTEEAFGPCALPMFRTGPQYAWSQAEE